jgi:mannose-6-phosphate isomerase-like protein (cupin superfamily)
MTSNKKSDIENFKKEIKEDIRPWGKFRSFPYKQARGIKIITVNPGETLSLQYHLHRSEFKSPHRLRCLGSKQARVMEIWIGNSDESDIVRLEDEYGRT